MAQDDALTNLRLSGEATTSMSKRRQGIAKPQLRQKQKMMENDGKRLRISALNKSSETLPSATSVLSSRNKPKRVVDSSSSSSSSSSSANCPKNVLPELETDMSERMLREETIRRMLRGAGGVDGWGSLWPGSSHFMLSCRNKCHVPSWSRFSYSETSVTELLQLS